MLKDRREEFTLSSEPPLVRCPEMKRQALASLLRSRFGMPTYRSADRFAGLVMENWEDITKIVDDK